MVIGMAMVDKKTVVALVERPHKGLGEVLLANPHLWPPLTEVPMGVDFVLQSLFKLGEEEKNLWNSLFLFDIVIVLIR